MNLLEPEVSYSPEICRLSNTLPLNLLIGAVLDNPQVSGLKLHMSEQIQAQHQILEQCVQWTKLLVKEKVCFQVVSPHSLCLCNPSDLCTSRTGGFTQIICQEQTWSYSWCSPLGVVKFDAHYLVPFRNQSQITKTIGKIKWTNHIPAV